MRMPGIRRRRRSSTSRRRSTRRPQARLDELKINLANTVISSPVNGFIGKRTLDPGAWVTPNSALLSVVDIGVVRIVANVVEKDLRRVNSGPARRRRSGRVSRGEIRRPRRARRAGAGSGHAHGADRSRNPEFAVPAEAGDVCARRTSRSNAGRTRWSMPANALVDVQGKRGVFRPAEGDTAKFHPIEVGLDGREPDRDRVGPRRGRPDRHDRRGGAAGRRQDRAARRARRRAGAAAGAAAAGQRAAAVGGAAADATRFNQIAARRQDDV